MCVFLKKKTTITHVRSTKVMQIESVCLTKLYKTENCIMSGPAQEWNVQLIFKCFCRVLRRRKRNRNVLNHTGTCYMLNSAKIYIFGAIQCRGLDGEEMSRDAVASLVLIYFKDQ